MAIPRELIEAVLKYRKRRQRPLGTTIPGYAGQCDFARPVTRVPGGGLSPPPSYVPRQDVYMSGLPEDYVPHPGFMEMPESEYEPYDGHIAESMSHMVSAFPLAPADMPRFETPGIDDSFANADFANGVAAGLPSIDDLTHALIQLREVFPEDHPDVLRLSTAIQALSYDTSVLQPEVPFVGFGPSGADAGQDPFDVDPFQEAEQIFDQQMQLLDQSFEVPGFETVDALDPGIYAEPAMFDLPMVNEFRPTMDPGPASLDDIVEAYDMPSGETMPGGMNEMPAYDNCLMTPDFFRQQMNGVMDQMGPEDPYMDPSQCDDMMPQDIYGQPMPDPMMDPYMMNPYMMPGPMGPNFMPDPPPGP